jgi:hypothetical protein
MKTFILFSFLVLVISCISKSQVTDHKPQTSDQKIYNPVFYIKRFSHVCDSIYWEKRSNGRLIRTEKLNIVSQHLIKGYGANELCVKGTIEKKYTYRIKLFTTDSIFIFELPMNTPKNRYPESYNHITSTGKYSLDRPDLLLSTIRK